MKCNKNSPKHSGLTLIEVLITLVILGIVSGIAYPTYTQQIRESHRMIALGDMLALQMELERSYNAGYQFNQVVSGGVCQICESEPGRYQFEVVSSATAAYTITAVAQSASGQSKDSCLDQDKTMTLNSTGETTPIACW
ncbi:type IV pilin protein [Vibrio hangzhouensis]|uniref:Type IV pilus assembly protein PilE n=1 Tax=Vibrio hangzhouensis TaxID=462991 RepID=A0A1H6ADB9_9VIBR|nr:type IV pilin protein [Vibrio hangzhouensis]SEG46372.1 type IV pilus assembly protein PilE [Vibrio hangzhouensis]